MMKHLYLTLLTPLICTLALGQIVTRHSVSGKELNNEMKQKYGVDMNKLANPLDRNIYDVGGAVVDSVTAFRKIKAFTHEIGHTITPGESESKRVLRRVDTNYKKRTYQSLRFLPATQPKSPLLQVGQTFDLKQLSRRVDAAKLKGKALLILFFKVEQSGSLPNQYTDINYAIENHIGTGNLEVLAITHEPFDVASAAMKKTPISNARLFTDAGGITDYFETERQQLTILTDKDHKIIFSVAQYVGVTPWVLNKLMSQIL